MSHGKPRVYGRRVLSGIIFINRNGLPWRDAAKEYGPAKTHYNRWSEKGIFASMMTGLESEAAVPNTHSPSPRFSDPVPDLAEPTLHRGG